METWTDIFRERFDEIFANKNLGQNFLFDSEILAGIVDSAELKSGENVLEIGPGLGTLTAEILSRGAKITCVEFDENLAKNLPENVAKIMKIREENGLKFVKDFRENLTVANADFLQFDLREISEKDYKIIANIPYNITKPIIEKIVESENCPELATLLIQQEVAEKIVAKNNENSVLSLRIQNFADVKTGAKISRKFFVPQPKVESKILILRPRKISKIREFYDKNFPQNSEVKIDFFAKKVWQIINAGFSQKRKKIQTSLAPIFAKNKNETAEFLRIQNVNPGLRAQNLSMETWCGIAKKVCENSRKKAEK